MAGNENMSLWAYPTLLAGGLLIVVGGVAGALMMTTMGDVMGFGMMGGYADYMTSRWLAGMAWWMALIGLLSGGLVLHGAYRLRHDPTDAATAGTLAIVGGALSLLAMGGMLLGAVLAILGGALALGAPRAAPVHPPRL